MFVKKADVVAGCRDRGVDSGGLKQLLLHALSPSPLI